MKPLQVINHPLARMSLVGLPMITILGAVGAIPGIADPRPIDFDITALEPEPSGELAALPATEKVWVKVRSDVSIESLSRQLDLSETKLATLNDVDEDHSFSVGDWLVVPSKATRKIKLLASLDTSELRRNPPIQSPPPIEDTSAVRFGDSLIKIAKRHGLSLQELLKLNPGLETARLVVGTQIRLAQSSPGRSRMVLGLKPVGSGGLSWPELPRFGNRDSRPEPSMSSAGWIWPTQGVFSSGYGWRWGRMHKGIDVANNTGTPIVASKAGRVSKAGWDDGGYGFLVEITHNDGSMSRYGHNSRVLVRPGDEVAQGAVISLMGSTGRSTGPHLHFEIHPAGGSAINPLPLLPGRA